MANYSVTIVGATGLVGTTLISLLEERSFPLNEIHFVASQQSQGKTIKFKGKNYLIEDLNTFDFNRSQIAFFCVANDLAQEFIPKATAAGNIVIDKSSFYRNHPDVPLIVPEVNPDAINNYRKLNIIANPNCNTIPIAVALKPIYDAAGIARINIATYQSVSGSGKDAVNELTEQSKKALMNQSFQPKVYSQQIAFNVLPHIDSIEENGYTREEMKMVWELRKIFNDSLLPINPTAVRVPVYFGHSASVHLETKNKIAATEVQKLLSKAPGIVLMKGAHAYPTPVWNIA